MKRDGSHRDSKKGIEKSKTLIPGCENIRAERVPDRPLEV
jgi:hypothetical protein